MKADARASPQDYHHKLRLQSVDVATATGLSHKNFPDFRGPERFIQRLFTKYNNSVFLLQRKRIWFIKPN